MRLLRNRIKSIALIALSCAGCIRVDASLDFRDASADIEKRNGVPDAYDPAEEAMCKTKTREYLEDGLTIDEAVSVALLNNPSFQSEFLAIGASRADLVQSSLLSNPTLFFSVRLPDAGGRSSLNFSVAQQLVDLWQIPVRKRIAQADLERTIGTVLDRGVQLAAEVRSQCIQLLALQRTEQIASDNLDLTRSLLKLSQARLDAGETDPTDVNLVNSHVYQAEQVLIAIRRDRQAAEVSLAALLGLIRWPEAWALRGSLEVDSSELIDANELVRWAEGERFDVRVVLSQIDSAEAQLEREYLEIFPNVMLGLEAERKDRRALPDRKLLADTARASVAAGAPTAPTIQSRGQRDLIRRQIVDSLLGPSVQLTLPIWDQNQAQIAKTRFAVLQLRKQYESLLDRVTSEVHQASISAVAARALSELLGSKALPRARENVEIIRTQYENGEQGILFLLEAQEALLLQSRACVDALRDQALAAAELSRAVGGRLPTALERTRTSTEPASSSSTNPKERNDATGGNE